MAVVAGVSAGTLAGVFFLAVVALVFFLVEVVASVWSVEGVDPVCCAARKARLPQIKSNPVDSEKNALVLHLIDSLPPLALTEKPSTFMLEVWGSVLVAQGKPCGLS